MERRPRIPYTPRHLAEKVLAQRSSLEGERKQVTVLFADVVDSAALAQQLGPEAWHGVLDGLFRILTEGVHRFEGTINQYTGDGVMALFGAPIAHEDHARRACYAALHVADRLDDYADRLARKGIELGVRTGLDSGDVVVGKIGDDLRMDYTAQGATVALAARLEELAEPGQVLLSARTAALVRGLVTLEDEGEHRFKGFPDAEPVFELVAADSDRTRLEVAAEGGLTPFVGRAPELDRLKRALGEALAGNGQVLRLSGAPGVGKSRLCFEFAEHCRQQGVRLFETSCPSHGRGVPLLALQGLVRRIFAIAPDDGDDLAREKIEHQLTQLALPVHSALPGFCELLHVSTGEAAHASPDRRDQRARLVRRLIQAQSASEPSVFLMDDAQWLDDESAWLVGEMLDALGWTRTLFVLSARPGPLPMECNASYADDLPVGPLAEADVRALVEGLLDPRSRSETLLDQVIERAGGNPFFAEEIAREVERTGEPGTPASVRVLLDARIDALGPEEKHVLRIGAAIGDFNDSALVARVAELGSGEELAALITEIESSGLIADGRFSHPLIREAAYESQLTESRQELHTKVAAALEATHADALGRHAGWIAHHWDCAGKSWIAGRWRRRAALQVSNIRVSGRDR